ncbi:hypothetical protein BGW39_002697, partial [Mortierella sp. 14UC]
TLKELIITAFKPEALVPRIQAYSKMLSVDAKWRTKDMTTGGVIPWVTQMSQVVANELGFQVLAGLIDRVPPPPKNDKNTGSIDNDDDEDEENGPNKNKPSKVGDSAASLRQAERG